MSDTEKSKTPATSEDEFFEDLQPQLAFQSDLYNISNLELVTSDTPSISPNISPSSAPKPGTVKNYSSLFANLEEENSNLTSNRGSNSRNKMVKVPRIRRAHNRFRDIIKQEIETLKVAIDGKKTEETKEQNTKLKPQSNIRERFSKFNRRRCRAR